MSIINKNLNLNLNVNFKSSLIKNTKEEESDKKDETLNDSNDNSSLFHDTSNDLVKNIDNNLILTTRNIKIDSINSALQKDSVNKIVAGQPQIKSNNTNNFSGTSITSSLSEALKEVEKNIYTDEDILKKIQEMCPDMSISNLSEYEETISCVLLSESAQGASQEKIIYMISSALNLGVQEELNDAEKIATELLSKLGNSLQTYLSNNSYVTFDSLTESLKQQNCTDEEIEICKKLITTYLSETFNGVFDVDQINRALNSNGIKIKNDSNNSLAVSISSSEAPSGFWISVGRFCSWLSSTTGYNAIMVVADYTPVSVIASAVDVGVTLSGVYYSMTYDREAYGREWLNGQDASQEECLDAAKNRAIFESACAIFGILPGFTAGALRKAFGNAPQKLFESLMANFDAILDELDKLNDIKTLKEFFRYVKECGLHRSYFQF